METEKENTPTRSERQITKEIIDNQEERTKELNCLENYFAKLLQILEKEWINEKKTHNWDYSNYCKNFMERVGGLNKQLRVVQNECENKNIINVINRLLSLEENHYKTTLSIFIKKIRHFDLLKKDADEEEFTDNENEIADLKRKQSDIRESINEIVTELKYSL